MAMDESIFVKIRERKENRLEDVFRFMRAERLFGKKSCQNFFGMFCNDVHHMGARNLTLTGPQYRHQVGIR